MLELLQPAALGALAALAVPLLIHLWNRRQRQAVAVGSLEWWEESLAPSFRSWVLRDPWRLLLRLILVGLLAFLLARPVWERPAPYPMRPSGWVLSEGPVPAEVQSSLQTLLNQNYEHRRLTPGFPVQTLENTTTNRVPNFWTLLPLLDRTASAPDTILIWAPAYRTQFTGMVPVLNKTIRWMELPGVRGRYLLRAEQRGDSLRCWLSVTAPDATRIEIISLPDDPATLAAAGWERKVDSLCLNGCAPLLSPDTLHVELACGNKNGMPCLQVRTALTILAEFFQLPLAIVEGASNQIAPDADALLWWGRQSPLPDFDGKLLVYDPEPLSRLGPIQKKAGRSVYVRDLNRMPAPELPRTLLRWLWEAPPIPPALDKRVLPPALRNLTEREPKIELPRSSNPEQQDLLPFFWLLAAALLAADTWQRKNKR